MSSSAPGYHHGNLRASLLEETARMIAEAGVGSVTMRALGERLGVSRAAAYRHFPDKTSLLAAVAAVGFENLNAKLLRIDADAPASGMERFRLLGEAYVLFALDNPAHYRLMYGEQSLARSEVPELRAAADRLFAHLAAIIESQQKAGRVKREDPQMLAYIAWSAMHGLASLLIDGQIDAATDVDQLIRHATRTVLDGMRAENT
jgi:AcrR family transcriptional regulator